jgi:transglutaminase-like putative cysteine protease
MPQDYVLRYKHLNFNGQPLAATDKNKKTLTWKIEQLPSVKKEFAAPRWQEITPMVSIAPAEFQLDEYKGDMTTWKEFGKFIYELTKNRDELPEDVKQKVVQLTAGLKTDVEKIQVLYRFLQQNTRYISIQLGIGGWQPFEASFVSKKGYGDCKALSNFMYSLLKAANIKSYYTLIKSGNYNYYMNEDFPSNQFDHVIVCVPLQKDTMWLECTSQTVAPGYMGEFTGNRKALLIDENGGTLVSTPRYTIRENLLVRKVRAKLDPDGTLGMKVHTRYGGTQQDELSMMINQLSKDKVQKILQEELELSTYSVDDFKYEETRAVLPELDEELSVTVSNYATISGKRIFITPNILNRNGTRLEQEEDRKVDFVFYSEYRDEDSCEIEIPDGYQLEAKPADVTLKTKFGTYTCSSKLEGNKISYHRVLEKYAGRFPVKDQAALIQFLGDIYTADRSRMVLVKKS